MMNISSDVIEELIELRKTENIEEIYKNYYLTCENSTRKYYLSEKKIKDLTLQFLITNSIDIEEFDFLDGEEQNEYKIRKKLITIFEKHIDDFAKEYVYVLSLKDNNVFIDHTIDWKNDIPSKFMDNKYEVESLIYIFPNADLIALNSLVIYYGEEIGFDKIFGGMFKKEHNKLNSKERIKYIKDLHEKDELIKKQSPLMIKLHKKKRQKKGKKLDVTEPPEILNLSNAFN